MLILVPILWGWTMVLFLSLYWKQNIAADKYSVSSISNSIGGKSNLKIKFVIYQQILWKSTQNHAIYKTTVIEIDSDMKITGWPRADHYFSTLTYLTIVRLQYKVSNFVQGLSF